MGKRSRQRQKLDEAKAPVSEYRDHEGNVLTLRGSLPAGARREYAALTSPQRQRTTQMKTAQVSCGS